MAKKTNRGKYYIGVDIGGTKILAALVRPSGKVIARKRCSTPRLSQPDEVLTTVVGLLDELLKEQKLRRSAVRAIGLAVPGIADAKNGRVVVTPNMNLTGFDIVPRLRKHFKTTIALGNDVNLGTLGEQWLGAAAFADSAIGIFIGTGIGGGIIVNGQLVTGHRGAAGEIGHMLMQRGGPRCGCGAYGCLEALASRTAIERDLRAAIAAGRKSILTKLADGDLTVIRSNVLKKALDEDDPLVKEIMTKASEVLGDACLELRHVLDPEVIVLGGGVMEACKHFIVPIVQKTIAADPLAGDLRGGKIVVSTLGDDAVVLGAAALALQLDGRDPFDRAQRTLRQYPTISDLDGKRVLIEGTKYQEDVFIRVDGKVRRRAKLHKKADTPALHQIDVDEIKQICKGKPSILVIGTGPCDGARLTAKAEEFLLRNGITYEVSSSQEAINTYNAIKGRKAALIHLAC